MLGLRRHDGMQHGVDHQVCVLEAQAASRGEVLVGQLDVLPVEDLLLLLVQFFPDVESRFHSHNVGGAAKVPWLDDADLKWRGIPSASEKRVK